MKKHRGRHLLSLLASAALLASLLPAAFAAEAEGEKHITILGTSDMHGNIWGYSYEDNAETDNNGMARLYTYIQQVRAENPNTFLVDAGDDIQGTIMTDDLYNKTPEEPHPVVTAMNYMGYDAMTLGNHEFNWGIPTMQAILGQASFPVLAANVTGAQGEPVTGAGWTIVERGGVKLAVIGVVTPDVPIWDSGKDGIDDAVYEAANVAVGKAIDEIGDQADVIMVSAHMGMYAEEMPRAGLREPVTGFGLHGKGLDGVLAAHIPRTPQHGQFDRPMAAYLHIGGDVHNRARPSRKVGLYAEVTPGGRGCICRGSGDG